MARKALPCIACGRELDNVDETATNQPYAGTAFTTHGHYGSTIFDPMNGEYLEINVCDLCLGTHRERVLQGKDSEQIIEGGAVVGMRPLDAPLRLVPWYSLSRSELDHVWEVAQTEFDIAPEPFTTEEVPDDEQ